LLFYSAGLGIPFMATGLAFGRLAGALNWVKRHSAAVTATSAVALGFFGVLLTMNRFVWLTQHLQSGMNHLGLGRLLTLG
jgi:cytochrome c-type biogenesis protein